MCLNAHERLRYPILLWTGNMFSARQIRIHEGLAWDRNSYQNHAILTILWLEYCTLVVLELTHMVVK